MDFAIIFHNKNKICKKLEVDGIDITALDQENFAWIHLDLNQPNIIKDLMYKTGLPEAEIKDIFENTAPYYFRHRQRVIIDVLQVCNRRENSISSSPILIYMTDRLILTANRGNSPYIEDVLRNYEESFKTVGKTPGFIFFLLWDSIIDGFLPQVFYIDEKLEHIEEQYLHAAASPNILDDIIGSKTMVRKLKQSLSPMQRSMRHLVSSKLQLISDEARKFLYGHFEHLDQLSNTIDSLQDRVHATLAGYNSILSQQINHSMKILAIIATIMMPLSLLAAIYGTNFTYIPELSWKYGYFVFLGVLFFMAMGMLILFKRKRWM